MFATISCRRVSNPDNVTVIHNGIDMDAFADQTIDRAIPHVGAQVRVGTVGSLTKRKGHSYLIEAFASLAQELPIRLAVIGEGPERVKLETMVTRLGLSERVEFMGYRADIPALLAGFDLYVHPATDEPFGIAILRPWRLGNV